MVRRPADFLALTKPRIVALVQVTVAAGYYLGMVEGGSTSLLWHTLLGSTFVAAGTNALNQVHEADVDALMHRTKHRPIPAGRLSRQAGGVFGLASDDFAGGASFRLPGASSPPP